MSHVKSQGSVSSERATAEIIASKATHPATLCIHLSTSIHPHHHHHHHHHACSYTVASQHGDSQQQEVDGYKRGYFLCRVEANLSAPSSYFISLKEHSAAKSYFHFRYDQRRERRSCRATRLDRGVIMSDNLSRFHDHHDSCLQQTDVFQRIATHDHQISQATHCHLRVQNSKVQNSTVQ